MIETILRVLGGIALLLISVFFAFMLVEYVFVLRLRSKINAAIAERLKNLHSHGKRHD